VCSAVPPSTLLRSACLTWTLAVAFAVCVRAQSAPTPASAVPVRSGAELYRAACAACHALHGTGAPRSVVGFDLPLPDFTDCAFATVEPDADWLAVTHSGGPVRGFDRRMPAFGDALTEDEILRTIEHVHTFCDDAGWPRGDLNLPRALVTEKAFPENEAVLTTVVGTGPSGSVVNEVLYEKRFGSRNQFEVAIPLALQETAAPEGWNRGLGDVAVAVKRAVAHSLERGFILSVAGEVVLPTGKEAQGLGKGVTIFEPFVAFGQILPRNAFFQAQVGAEVPADRDRAEPEAFWRGVLGTTIEQGRFGRAWSPMVELLGARELERGQPVQWDVVPQMQVTLNRRQHLMINVGVRVPVTGRDERHAQVMTYFLWDWFDGGLADGW
jgi:mono/diheme cytochrome c family protein